MERIATTISDGFTILGEITLLTNEPKFQPFFRKISDLCGIKRDKALNFLFLLGQKIKRNYTCDTIQVNETAKAITECVNRFAPERI